MDKKIDKGNSNRVINPTHQWENPTAKVASKTMIDITPAITAFFIFCGEFSLYAFNKGLNTKKANSNKKGIDSNRFKLEIEKRTIMPKITLVYNPPAKRI